VFALSLYRGYRTALGRASSGFGPSGTHSKMDEMQVERATCDLRANLLTVEQVGERVQLAPATILHRYTKRLPFVRIGRRLMLSEADLLLWIEQRRSK
jgi:Helix-turn-helix domain